MEKKNNKSPFALGFILGSLIGAILIVFIRTKKGKKIAFEYLHKLEKLFDKIENSAVNRSSDLVKEASYIKDKTGEKLSKVKKETIELKEKILSSGSNGVSSLEQQGQNQLKNFAKSTKEVADKVTNNLFSRQGKKKQN